MKKREPLLCDKLLLTGMDLVGKNFLESTKQNVREAKRFVLNKEATIFIAEMLRDMPRIIADAQDFAIPPFHKTWVEFPFLDFWRVINGREPDADADAKIGFLFVGNTVRVVTGGQDEDKEALVLPVEYHLWKPLSLEDEIKCVKDWGTSRGMLDYVFWGESVNHFRDDPDKEGLRALRNNHSMYIPDAAMSKDMLFDRIIMRSAGDLRNIIAMLLFLNRTRDLQSSREVPHQQAMRGGKPGVLLKHSVITLKLNPGERLQNLVAGHSVWKRLHDVRGHFCHNKVARESSCMHAEWVEYEPLKWKCEKCGGLRWWRKEHKRGHEEKGLVTSEYRVVA